MKYLVFFNSGVLASTEYFSDFLFEGKNRDEVGVRVKKTQRIKYLIKSVKVRFPADLDFQCI